MRRWRRKPEPVFFCEVCGLGGVERRGEWDYCPKGHIYVGKRADAQEGPSDAQKGV